MPAASQPILPPKEAAPNQSSLEGRTETLSKAQRPEQGDAGETCCVRSILYAAAWAAGIATGSVSQG